MNCRKATQGDVDITYQWATDPLVRKNSYNQSNITYQDHISWFEKKIQESKSLFLVFEDDDTPVGLVRFEGNDHHSVVGITVAPDCRGKGYASRMLISGLEKYSENWDMPVYAYIKEENMSSIKAFERAGFKFDKDLDYLGTPSKLYIWK